jgi:EAL and modified HD-GYP domain-containing signal transduction protein
MHGNQHTGLLAENVETREDFEDALRAGFHYFQGYFFRKPEMISTASIASNRILYLQLLQSVARPDLRWDEVEDLIKRDAALFYRLLRYLNSALFGIRGEVRTVNQALVLLGENELRRWCWLAGVFELSNGRPSDLILSALVRARLGELLQPHVEHIEADLFTVGLLSFMDAILQVQMSVVLNDLPLDPASTAMLLENEGPLLPFYRLIWAIESGAWAPWFAPATSSNCRRNRSPVVSQAPWNGRNRFPPGYKRRQPNQLLINCLQGSSRLP